MYARVEILTQYSLFNIANAVAVVRKTLDTGI